MQWSCLVRLLGILSLAAVSQPWFGWGAAGIDDNRRISLQVVSGFGDQPLADRRITVTSADFRGGRPVELTSDADGRIELPAQLMRDTWPAWRFVADGFVPVRLDLANVLTETDHWQGLLKLQRSVTGGGRVMADDGRPVAGAQIALILEDDADLEWYEPRRFHLETTDSEGRWTCAHLPEAGVTSLRVVHPDYAPLLAVATEGTGRASYRIEELKSRRAVLFLQRGIRVRGRVIDARGDPVEGVRVWSGHYPVWTPADGRFELSAAPEAPVWLRLQKAGYEPRAEQIDAAVAREEVLLTLELTPPRRIIVRDGAGKPLVGALVRAIDPGHGLDSFLRVDAEGAIALEGGEFKVSIFLPGFQFLKELVVPADSIGTTVTLRSLSQFSLRVLHEEAGEPFGAFEVTPGIVDEGSVTWLTDRVTGARDGHVVLRFDPSVRAVQLAVAATGHYRQVTAPIMLTASGAAAEVRLRRQKPIVGLVRDSRGPLAGIKVVAIPEGAHCSLGRDGSLEAPAEWMGVTNDEGQFRLTPPGPAAWVAAAHEEKGFQVEQLVKDRESIEIELGAWAEVTGIVQQEGQPVPDQLVALGSRAGAPVVFNANAYVVRADAQGRFRLGHVPAGVHFLGKWNSMNLTHGELVEVTPGARLAVDFPRPGWRITGEARLPGIELDWNEGPHLARLRRREPGGSPVSTPYDVTVAADGTFSVTDVPPGAFELVIHFHEPATTGSGVKCRYRISTQLDLPPLPADADSPTRELGPLWLGESPAVNAAAPTTDE